MSGLAGAESKPHVQFQPKVELGIDVEPILISDVGIGTARDDVAASGDVSSFIDTSGFPDVSGSGVQARTLASSKSAGAPGFHGGTRIEEPKARESRHRGGRALGLVSPSPTD